MSQETKDSTRAVASHTEKRFTDSDAARAYLEGIRWPNGPVCPHCGGTDRQSRIEGKSARPGLLACGHCRQQYTVTVGTVFEDSHVPLHKWVYANHLICSSKKGISSKQLERVLGVSYKTAWFMSHRLRYGMRSSAKGPLGGGGKIVEVDETYLGNKKGVKKARVGGQGMLDKRAIVALVERNGEVRGFHVPNVNRENLGRVLYGNIARDTHVMTDEATRYWNLGQTFAKHSSVNHSRKEYARGDVTTNTVEGFFSILKRGITGIYQCVSEEHLQRYVDEFSFRYNNRAKLGVNDEERAIASLKGIAGKRLTYRRTDATA